MRNPEISDKLLLDDRVIEVTWDGEIVWDWKVSDHFEELGLDLSAKLALYHNPNMEHYEGLEDAGDWVHVNCCSVLGENRWYDAGDERFHPDNLIMDCREANIMFIVSKKTGEIVWRLGPDFSASKELIEIGQIIGQHHCHMISRGLPGEGNIMIFDNGGFAGYGAPGSGHPDGTHVARRHYSRVIELDPVAMKIVWQYPSSEGLQGHAEAMLDDFFSCLVSSAQRLPNGNTMICEGVDGRFFEVTLKREIVWEYISPYVGGLGSGGPAPTGNAPAGDLSRGTLRWGTRNPTTGAHTAHIAIRMTGYRSFPRLLKRALSRLSIRAIVSQVQSAAGTRNLSPQPSNNFTQN